MRRLRPARGQAAVEFALIVPIFVLLLVGLFDVGRVVFAANDASHAARDSTRAASVSPLDCDSIFYIVQHQIQGDSAVSVAVSYRAGPSPSNQNPAWSNVCPAYDPTTTYDNDPATGTMSTAVAPDEGGEIRAVVTNPVTLATPLIGNLVGGPITVRGSSAMVVTYVPR
jgi:Flp pilus assembly protein TadG